MIPEVSVTVGPPVSPWRNPGTGTSKSFVPMTFVSTSVTMNSAASAAKVASARGNPGLLVGDAPPDDLASMAAILRGPRPRLVTSRPDSASTRRSLGEPCRSSNS